MRQSFAYELAQVMPAAVASGLFASLCSAQSPDGAFGGSGAPSGTYSPVSGLQNIACMNAPQSTARIQAIEAKGLAEIAAEGFRHVLLKGSYPAFVAGVRAGWRVIINDVPTGLVTTYDVLGAEPDSQGTQTRLDLRLVTV